MALPVAWLPEATEEYYEAISWYEGKAPGLGERFALIVEQTVVDIAEAPLIFPVAHKDRRRAGMRRFPYGLFFVVETKQILVIACFHGKRDPRKWTGRW